jgi:hypothetical protein
VWAAAVGLQTLVLITQERLPLLYAAVGTAIYYGVLALLAIPVWRLCARIAERRPRWWVVAPLHLATALAVIAAWQGTYLGILYLLAGRPAVAEQLQKGGLWLLLQDVFVYSVLLTGIVALQGAHRLRLQRAREEQLTLLAREAEVRALRAQLRPHFLFNVLNSIYSLIASRPREAERMVALLAELMRRTLDVTDEELVPLHEELRLVESYLEIERVRLGDRLAVEWRVEPAAERVLVPPFLLQPLVENAILHGIARSDAPGCVTVTARPLDGGIELRVRDTGNGERGPRSITEGRGLGITRQRLATNYTQGARLAVQPLDEGGFEACLLVPAIAMTEGNTLAAP